jgi:multicomponent Na+:H+ antiporter subunit E
MVLLNFLLALAWLALTGEFTILNFLFGLFASAAMIWLVLRVSPFEPRRREMPAYGLKGIQLISFGLYFIWELILANVRVAIDVMRPRPQIAPAVVAVPLDGYSDAEVTLLANFITLTPGTLSLDVVERPSAQSDETEPNEAQPGEVQSDKTQRVLYVHAMHAGRTQAAIEDFRRQLSQNLGNRVKEVMS